MVQIEATKIHSSCNGGGVVHLKNTSDSPLQGSCNGFIKLLTALFLPTPSPPAFVRKRSDSWPMDGFSSVYLCNTSESTETGGGGRLFLPLVTKRWMVLCVLAGANKESMKVH